MNHIFYVPIYEWGPDPDSWHGTSSGTHFYLDLHDLYMTEPNAVGYLELTGEAPTENEFKRKHGLKSEAV